MIRRVFSSLPTFKEFHFKNGLNVVLATRSEGAGERQTRNRAGKSSLVEVIHFVLGSKADKTCIFKNEVLNDHTFGMEFDVDGVCLEATRSGAESSIVRVRGLDATMPEWLTRHVTVGRAAELGVREWCDLLGERMFRLESSVGPEIRSFAPTFRGLVSYFVRRQSGDGFKSPYQNSAQQQPWDSQVCLSYLLGLDWSIPRERHLLQEQRKQLAGFRKVAGEAFRDIVGVRAELRTAVANSEERVRGLERAIQSFRVLEAYRETSERSNALTRQMNDLANEDHVDRGLISQIEGALREEHLPAQVDLESLYREAGVVLPELSIRRYEEVAEFHHSVVRNRREYLGAELERLGQRLASRRGELEQLEAERGELMALLRSGGALDELTALQTQLGRERGALEDLRRRHRAAEMAEMEGTRLSAEEKQVQLRLQEDFQAREGVLQKAIVLVNRITGALYEQAGQLIVTPNASGPKWEIRLEGARSKGVRNMVLFSFDMLLLEMAGEAWPGPGFVMHDSHLFDGVDPRQVGKALMLGKELALKKGWQYMVTLNESEWPSGVDRPQGFDLDSDILAPRLTDATETGGLFGTRFE